MAEGNESAEKTLEEKLEEYEQGTDEFPPSPELADYTRDLIAERDAQK